MSKFTPLALVFVFGAAVGVGCGFLLATRNNEEIPVSQIASPEVVETQDIEQLELQLANLERENADLKQALEAVPEQVDQNVSVSKPSSRKISLFRENGELKHLRPQFASMADNMVARISGRLGLNEEQQAAMKEIFMAQHEQEDIIVRRFNENRNGTGDPIEIITSDDVFNLAREIMTPDQFDSYLEMKRQERETRTDVIATMQLGSLSSNLGLSEEQKDIAYSAYYSAAAETGDVIDSKGMDELRSKAEEIIEDMLTPEQKKLYEDLKARIGGPVNRPMFLGN